MIKILKWYCIILGLELKGFKWDMDNRPTSKIPTIYLFSLLIYILILKI